ncbi:MAG TPA: VOC family protein [Anaerolineales bacterium]|nr:VOC family protein [Anaerolineales bacterium]
MESTGSNLFRTDTVMFEYDVHDMQRTVQWYQDMFGFEIIFGPTDCHTEFSLPLKGARLALSLADETVRIQKGSRLFLATRDIQSAEAYLKAKGARTKPIENVDNVVLVLWVEDPEGNYLAVEQRLI